MVRFQMVAPNPGWGSELISPGFEGASPSEVAWQVLGGDAVEAVEPLLEAAVVGVDVIDVQVRRLGGRLFPAKAWAVKGNFGLAREGGQRLAAIADEMISRRYDARQHGGDRGAVVVRQNGVEGRPLPVAGDKEREYCPDKGRDAWPFRLACGPCAAGVWTSGPLKEFRG